MNNLINKNTIIKKFVFPYPHIVFENFFEEKFYKNLEKNFPLEVEFEKVENKVNRMNYDISYGDELYSNLIKKNISYNELHKFIYSNNFVNYFLKMFKNEIINEIFERFLTQNVLNFPINPEPFEVDEIISKRTHKSNDNTKILYPRLDIGMGKKNYGINTGGKGIHIDNPQRLISILFYLGGYSSVDGGEHRIWKVKNSENLELEKEIQPKPNLLIASLQNNISFHDVKPIKEIAGSRNAFYIAISSSVKIWKDVKNNNLNKKFNRNRYISKSFTEKIKRFLQKIL